VIWAKPLPLGADRRHVFPELLFPELLA
jgi:hypothetical protein